MIVNISGIKLDGNKVNINVDISKGKGFQIITYDDELIIETRHDTYWIKLESLKIKTIENKKLL